jgi:hypothetical protein
MITANQSPLAFAGGGIRILLPLVLVLAASIDAFSFTLPKLNPVNPALQDMSQAQDGILINIRLDVGQKEDSHLLIDGLAVELHDDAIDTKKAKNSVPLPGSSGPNPHLSSGAKTLQVLDAARFIGLNGINHVDLQNGCWEMVWREGAPAGVIVCGFNLAEDVQRGDASLPKGRIYLSLPVWTRDGLTEKQTLKAEKIAEAEQHKIDQADDIAKMQATTNPLMKALHYRNALAASEKIMMSGVKGLVESVPENEDVMPIGDGLVMCTKGTVWTKGGSFLREEHVLLGVANASPEIVTNDLAP